MDVELEMMVALEAEDSSVGVFWQWQPALERTAVDFSQILVVGLSLLASEKTEASSLVLVLFEEVNAVASFLVLVLFEVVNAVEILERCFLLRRRVVFVE